MKLFRLIAIVAILSVAFGAVGSVSAAKFPSYASGIQIQNVGTAPATVTLNFYVVETGVLRESVPVPGTVAAGSSVTYAALPLTGTDPFSGSMIISADQPIAAISNIARAGGTARASYVGVSAGSTSVVVPLLQKNNGSRQWTTWISVQNVGNAAANVSIDYTDCTSDPAPVSVPANASHVFDQATETCHSSAVFGATITSVQPLAAVVLQESSVANSILAYTGFTSAGTVSPMVPLVNANNSGWQTGIQIINKGTLSTDLTLTYKRASDGTTCTETQTITAGATKVFAGQALVSGSGGGITTTCTPGQLLVGAAYVASPADNSAAQPLLAIVNQTKVTTSYLGGSYSAFDPAIATDTVVFPLIMDRNGSTQWRTGFNVMNVGTASTFVKCTFTGAGSGVVVQQEVLPLAAMNHNQQNNIAAGYVGSATCQAYTSSAYTTLDTAAKLVGVANESGNIASAPSDLLLTYEGINVQ